MNTKYAIVVTCAEVRGESGAVIVSEGTKRVLVNGEWVRGEVRPIFDGRLPSDARTFDSREEAEAFARDLDSPESKANTRWWMTWHPWYVQPKSWEVVELKPIMETKQIGWRSA